MAWVQAIGEAVQGNQQRVAADNAANSSIQGNRDAINAGMAVYNQNRQDNYNNMVVGNSALNMLAKMYGLDHYTGTPSYQGITVSGGETTVDKPSTFQKFMDPGGLWWSQSSNTTPMQFSAGGSGPTVGTVGGNALVGGTAASNGATGTAPGNIVTGTGQADYSSFFMGPDYQVKLKGGLQGADRSAAARGSLYSGRHAADITDYAGDMATSAFGDYKNSLLNLAGFGSQAVGNVGSAGNQFGSQAGNAAANMGNARASGYVNQANSWTNQINNWGQTFGDWWGNRQGGQG